MNVCTDRGKHIRKGEEEEEKERSFSLSSVREREITSNLELRPRLAYFI